MPCHVRVPRYQVVHHLLQIWPALTKMLLHVGPIKSHRDSFSNSRQTERTKEESKQKAAQVSNGLGREWRVKFTVCSSTPLLICSSLFRRFLNSASCSSSPTSGSALTARLRFPETSSARRCCRSAGVSVQRVVSTSLLGAALRAN